MKKILSTIILLMCAAVSVHAGEEPDWNAEGLAALKKGDKTRAVSLFETGAAKGDTDAMFNASVLLFRANEPQKALRLLEQAAEKGHPEAMLNLGIFCETGARGVKRDEKRALKLYLESSSKGCADAEYTLGRLYERGRCGVAVNPALAFKHYAKGAENGSPPAMNSLGMMYFKGIGTERDLKRALSEFLRSAFEGDKRGMMNAAFMYRYGYGTKKSAPEALKWYTRAAEAGHGSAGVCLAQLYIYGDTGVAHDYPRALLYAQKAMEDGNIEGDHLIGLLFLRGWGVEKNEEVAAKYFLSSANAGYPQAMIQTAVMYRDGVGVPKDHAKYLEWMRKAVPDFKEDAPYTLKHIAPEGELDYTEYENNSVAPQAQVEAEVETEKAK